MGGRKSNRCFGGPPGPRYIDYLFRARAGYSDIMGPGTQRSVTARRYVPQAKREKSSFFLSPEGPPLGPPLTPPQDPPQAPFWGGLGPPRKSGPPGPPGAPGTPARPLLRTRFFGVSPVHGSACKLFRPPLIFDPPPGPPPRGGTPENRSCRTIFGVFWPQNPRF